MEALKFFRRFPSPKDCCNLHMISGGDFCWDSPAQVYALPFFLQIPAGYCRHFCVPFCTIHYCYSSLFTVAGLKSVISGCNLCKFPTNCSLPVFCVAILHRVRSACVGMDLGWFCRQCCYLHRFPPFLSALSLLVLLFSRVLFTAGFAFTGTPLEKSALTVYATLCKIATILFLHPLHFTSFAVANLHRFWHCCKIQQVYPS